MKLITAIVNKEDSKNVCNELIKAKFYVTRLAFPSPACPPPAAF